MNTTTPLFSIITVCRNAEQTILPTLRSVAEQTFTHYEHLIVDGASTDQTWTLVLQHASPQAVCSSEPDTGLYNAMNKGIAKARGAFLWFLNAGDTFATPHILQQVADSIAQQKQIPHIVYGDTMIVDAAYRPLHLRRLRPPKRLTPRSFQSGMLVCHQAFVVHRSVVENYDEKYRLSADFDWAIRVLKKSTFNLFVPQVLVHYLQEGLTTKYRKASLQERFQIMTQHYGWFATVLRHCYFLVRLPFSRLFSKIKKINPSNNHQ